VDIRAHVLPRPDRRRRRKTFRAIRMMHGKRVVVVMPAYNAARTLAKTHAEVLEHDFVDRVILVDDASRDETVALAMTLPRTSVHVHPINTGYGGNQKSCYRLALDAGADVVVMVHPDYQYTPKLLPALVAPIAFSVYDCMLGSRIIGGRPRTGGMPAYKYVANRALTLAENVLLGAKLSEYHSGYRAFSREVLLALPLQANSDDFVFDNQVLAEILWCGFRIGEVSCPTKYFDEASSINFARSLRYGFGCLGTALDFRLAAWGILSSERYPRPRVRIEDPR
jgi:glycosyltransferase involved in cell wall biosynthesis